MSKSKMFRRVGGSFLPRPHGGRRHTVPRRDHGRGGRRAASGCRRRRYLLRR